MIDNSGDEMPSAIGVVHIDVGKLMVENRFLRTENQLLKSQLKLKDEEIVEILQRLNQLDDVVEENRILKEENESLRNRVEALERVIHRISVREAMRALENYIVLETLGSKNQMRSRKIYTAKQLSKKIEEDSDIKDSLLNSQWKDNYNTVFDFIDYFKNLGDTIVHDGDITKDNLYHVLVDGEYEEHELESIRFMVDQLDIYCNDHNKPYGKGPLWKPQ